MCSTQNVRKNLLSHTDTLKKCLAGKVSQFNVVPVHLNSTNNCLQTYWEYLYAYCALPQQK